MSNLSTAALVANEIAKAVDFSYANDQSISNISVALRAIMTGDNTTDYVIGGKVTPYLSGGMNLTIDPIYGHCKVSGIDIIDTELNQPISVESAHTSMDRFDTVQIRGKETLSDYQQRKFKDPGTGVITAEIIPTKKTIAFDVMVKKGVDGSVTAPLTDSGWIKLAEIFIPAGTVSMGDEHIRNITARVSGNENTAWTIEKNRVFNPGFLSEIIAKFLQAHKEDGKHKANSIGAEHIKFGIENGEVNGGVMPMGKSMTIRGDNYTSQMSMATIVSGIAAVINTLFPYANNLLGRYSYIDVQPIAASTENVDIDTGGEMIIDDIACTVGQMVFLKDQTDKKQNGFWVVHTGAWNRQPGYAKANAGCFDSKLIFIETGIVNKGKIFYLENDAYEVDTDLMDFKESIFSLDNIPGKVPIRDRQGDLKAKTQNTTNNSEYVATTAFVKAAMAVKADINNPTFTGTVKVPSKTSAAANEPTLVATEAQVYLKANLASPEFTGKPTAPTPTAGLNNTEITNTAFVKQAVENFVFPKGSHYTQYPNDPTPTERGLPGTWELWNERAEMYELITEAAYNALFSAVPSSWTVSSTIAAGQYRIWTPMGVTTSGTRRIIKSNKSVTAAAKEMNPIDWDDLSNITCVERKTLQTSWTEADYAIGKSVTYNSASYRVVGILTVSGLFLSFSGGNRPTFVSGGIGGDTTRKIPARAGINKSIIFANNAGACGCDGAFYDQQFIGSGRSWGENWGEGGGIGLDISRVAPVGPENSVRTISTKFWRRVS